MTIRPGYSKFLALAGPVLIGLILSAADQPAVHVESMNSVGPRPMEKQTQSSIVRDYLLAWQTLRNAMAENQADLLDTSFVGQAREELAVTLREQQNLGIQSTYQDKTHDIRVVFYSPEGLSIQLLDDVEYDVEVRQHGRSLGVQHVRARYIAVLTPAEAKWKVRVFQGVTS